MMVSLTATYLYVPYIPTMVYIFFVNKKIFYRKNKCVLVINIEASKFDEPGRNPWPEVTYLMPKHGESHLNM